MTDQRGDHRLVVRKLRKSYRKRPVIRDVSIDLAQGEVVALLPDDRLEQAVEEAARQARLAYRPGVPVGLWVAGDATPAEDAAATLALVGLAGLAAWAAALVLTARRLEAA